MQKQGLSTKMLVLIPAMTGCIVLCSWIAVPSIVPFTLQTMGVFLAVGLLGTKGGLLSVLLYFILGIIGLPVFAGMKGGAGVLLGPTGGYLIGFAATALVMGSMLTRSQKGWRLIAAMTAGLTVCYAFGTLWFMAVYTTGSGPVGLGSALSMCVLPYLLPDAAKIACSALLIRMLQPVLLRMGFTRW